MAKYNLEEILPHKYPMIFLDDIVKVDIKNHIIVTEFIISEDKLFYEPQGVNSLIGIEFMAQTIGCYAYFNNGMKKPKVGLLLGSKLYNNKYEYFKLNEKYTVSAKEAFSDGELSSFDCIIYDSNQEEVASASITVYQGDKEWKNG